MFRKDDTVSRAYDTVKEYTDRAMALHTAMTLFEWDNETLAPEAASELTSRMVGKLSGEYFQIITDPALWEALEGCSKEELTTAQAANVRELKEEIARIRSVPKEEYEAFASLTACSASVWAAAKRNRDFEAFAPVLREIICFKKRFAALRADDSGLYDVMLREFEPDFTSEDLDAFFDVIRRELAPFLKRVMEEGRQPENGFLSGAYSEKKQEELARFLASYVGFDFGKGVLAVSAHPFTTNLHNRDVRITTHYTDRVDSSLFSVIHEAGHGIYEFGIRDDLTLTFAGQGASMAMHESQSRFFENIIGRSPAFWEPIYEKVQEMFPEELGTVSMEQFVSAINRAEPGLIRTEADELSYSLHVLIRYEIERLLIDGELEVSQLPALWTDKYEEYLGVRPENPAEGVLQDIHWAQGSFGYFPSYALGSAFAAQIYFHMKKEMDFEGLLRAGKLSEICSYLREHIHQYGKEKTSRQILRELTGEDFDPHYYVDYLKEKYAALYGITL